MIIESTIHNIEKTLTDIQGTDAIANKVWIRKEAIKDLDRSASIPVPQTFTSVWENENDQNQRLQMIKENFCGVEEKKYISFYQPIQGRGVKKFLKRVTRKLLKIFYGWFFIPKMENQNFFNGKTANCISLMTHYIDELSQNNRILLSKTNEITSKVEILEQSQKEYLCQIEEEKKQRQYLEERLDLVFDALKERINNEELFAKLSQMEDNMETLQKEKLEYNDLQKIFMTFEQKIDKKADKEEIEKFTEAKLETLEEKICNQLEREQDPSQTDRLIKENAPSGLYMEFENRFRGSREVIKEMQKIFLPYFVDREGEVVEIGCGRGEFLELLYQNKVNAVGVEINDEFVSYCFTRGLNVKKNDALTFLSEVEDTSLAGVFISQVVEHLDFDYLLATMSLIYRKLRPGNHLVIETPNCEALEVYRTFYLDPTHTKPIPFETLRFYLEKIGFTKIERIENEFSKNRSELFVNQVNEESSRENFANLNKIIYGSKDYILIATK